MQIQKIFSDDQNSEKLYSVLIDEEELRLFSILQEKLFGKFDRFLIKKELGLPDNEITDKMVKEHRISRGKRTNQEVLGASNNRNLNQTINERTLRDSRGTLFDNKTVTRMREGMLNSDPLIVDNHGHRGRNRTVTIYPTALSLHSLKKKMGEEKSKRAQEKYDSHLPNNAVLVLGTPYPNFQCYKTRPLQ